MAVSNNTIIQKMMNELQQAKEKQNNQSGLIKHIANVQVLCDLILDENTVSSDETNQIDDKEMKAMIGAGKSKDTISKESQMKKSVSSLDHGEANGGSIFDF